jgi:predicted hotdog family 3-hydroxylacyl-ACP dehydratase
MLLVDAVVAQGEESVECRARVREDNPFQRSGSLRAVVCLEYMAQAVAAFAGLRSADPGPPRIGYLIAANRLVLSAAGLAVGDELSVHAKRVWGEASLGNFECSVVRLGVTIAQGTLSVYRPPPAAEPRSG